MKTIYKSEHGKAAVLRLYDSQLSKLGCGYRDIFLDTSFGKTHLVETGNEGGPALLVFHGGLMLEEVFDTDYTTLVNSFAENELGLTDTKISDQSGDLGHYWDWKANDAYLPVGGITSNIADMLSYAQMQLESEPYFSDCHKSLETINVSSEDYKTMGIHMDEIGMSWIIDEENGIIWHNGGTGNYNSYLGFRPETGTAVVVLSNLDPNARIPATVLGVKLLMERSRA